jgi:CheY-like chemotaxis protein
MDLEQLNILLADDDVDDCIFFKKALGEIQPSVNLTTVRDGEQLMHYLSTNILHLPDVLFLDLNMPRKNGFECLCDIKEDEKLKDIFVVMFSTSYPRDENYEKDMISRLLKIGAHLFIRKPNDIVQLKQAIQLALTKAGEYILFKKVQIKTDDSLIQ